MIKVGKYTAALLLVTTGALLLIDLTTKSDLIGRAVQWWPVILIGLGIEYLVFGAVYRDPDKKVGFALGSLILSVVLSVVVVGVTHGSQFNVIKDMNIGFGWINFADESGIKYEKGVTKATLSPNTDKVFIDNPNGTVKLQAADVSAIEIDLTVYVPRSVKDEADAIAESSVVQVKENGSTLQLIASGKEYRMFGMKQKPRMNLVITIPQAQAMDYELNMTNGKVEAAGIAIADHIQIKTTNGEILVHDMDGNVTANTTNGKIQISQVRGHAVAGTTNGIISVTDIDGDAAAKTTNGKVTLERVTGNVRAKATNGEISLLDVEKRAEAETTNGGIVARTRTLGGDWQLETTHGKIQVYLPPEASFHVDGESNTAGGIDTDFPLRVSKDEISGSVNGGRYQIDIETNSKIEFYRNE